MHLYSENKAKDTDENTKIITQDVELRRKNGIFGFNLAYSNAFTKDSCDGQHIIHWVEIDGPAFEAGLRDGDKIIAVSVACDRRKVCIYTCIHCIISFQVWW